MDHKRLVKMPVQGKHDSPAESATGAFQSSDSAEQTNGRKTYSKQRNLGRIGTTQKRQQRNKHKQQTDNQLRVEFVSFHIRCDSIIA